ncbi:ankyrin het domain-containing protein [Fusarium coicis]|nr:ankyrin het domain-containing protein [Fusarium coicis]
MESLQIDLIEPPKIPTYTTDLPPLKYEKLPTLVTDLNGQPKYDALSYTWGDPLGCYHLTKSRGSSVSTPMSNMSEYIWIDQICINQTDIVEKSSQVQLMGQIYRQCAAVQIWLGDRSHGLMYKSFDITDQQTCQFPGIRPISLEKARGTLDLFNRAWFKRSWIIQEALLAPMSNALFGAFAIPFQNLSKFMLDQVAYRLGTRSFNSQDQYWEQPLPIDTVTRMFRACEATDPRDKVYAFIGISENGASQKGPLIIPDYSKMVDDVYIDATKLMMSSKGFSLDCVSQKEDEGLRRIKSLPSWVPDFSVDLGHNPLAMRAWMFAAGPRAPTSHFRYLPSNCIELRGSRVDAVRLWKGEVVGEKPLYAGQNPKTARQIGEMMGISTKDVVELMALVPKSSTVGPQSADLSYRDEHDAKSCSPVMSTSVQIAPNPEKGDSYQSRTEVFWRTMMKDIGNNRYPAEERCGEELLKEMEEVVFHERGIMEGVMPYGTTDTQNPKHFAGARSVILSRRGNAVDERLWQNFLDYRVNLPTRMLGLCNPDAYRLNVKEEVFMTAKGRVLFVTDKGRLGWGLLSTRAGDEVWILEGCRVPCLLRPTGDGRYKLVGEAYVHGIMHGEDSEGSDVKDLDPVVIV